MGGQEACYGRQLIHRDTLSRLAETLRNDNGRLLLGKWDKLSVTAVHFLRWE
jgi:hypothetical protein